jgi:hypothetical protein
MREYRTLSSRGGRRELRPWHLAATGAACLLLGIVVGYRAGGDDEGDGTGGTPSGSDEQAVTDSLIDGAVVTTTSTAPVLPATQVRVMVLNGAGIDGEAGRQSDDLAEQGYQMLEPGNTDAATMTAVYHAPDFEDECQALRDIVSSQRGEEVALLAIVDTLGPVEGADCVVVVAAPGLSPTTTTSVAGATTSTVAG